MLNATEIQSAIASLGDRLKAGCESADRDLSAAHDAIEIANGVRAERLEALARRQAELDDERRHIEEEFGQAVVGVSAMIRAVRKGLASNAPQLQDSSGQVVAIRNGKGKLKPEAERA